MGGATRGGTAEPTSRDQNKRQERGQGKGKFGLATNTLNVRNNNNNSVSQPGRSVISRSLQNYPYVWG